MDVRARVVSKHGRNAHIGILPILWWNRWKSIDHNYTHDDHLSGIVNQDQTASKLVKCDHWWPFQFGCGNRSGTVCHLNPLYQWSFPSYSKVNNPINIFAAFFCCFISLLLSFLLYKKGSISPHFLGFGLNVKCLMMSWTLHMTQYPGICHLFMQIWLQE